MDKGESFRRRVLLVLVAVSVTIAWATELLGLLHAIARTPLLVLWFVVLAIAVVALRRTGLQRVESVFDLAIAGSIAVIGIVTALVAWISPPNSVDAFSYHLARVVYWAQAGSTSFFPTHYFNQISMPPFAEYVILHGYLISGGDHFANLTQWAGFMGSILGVSLIAGELGAGRRGQMLAALICATLPNGILQASGTKNDAVLALWLVAMVYFALRYHRDPNRVDGLAMAASLGLSLLTKSTAWVFATALLASGLRTRLANAVPVLLLGAVALNGAHWWRNFDLSGSILGFASAQEDGKYRWTVDKPGAGATVSNMLRNASEQLGARSRRWNEGVYNAVVGVHRALHLDPNDPASTFPGSTYAPPKNSNHEAEATNRVHLFLLVAGFIAVALLRRRDLLWYGLGIVLAYVLFCAVLKYQTYFSRMMLPLFVLGAPLIGVLAARMRPAVLQGALCLLLLDQARHPLLENWTRPLTGPASLLRTSRNDNYFRDIGQFEVRKEDYERSVEIAAASGCNLVGIDNGQFQLEYPFQALLLQRRPDIKFVHSGVMNASAKYGSVTPCLVLCLGCSGVRSKMDQYRALGEPVQVNRFLIYGVH